MALPVEQYRCTVAEYLRLEQEANEKHEYRNGEVIAMAGGSVRHSRIIANMIRSIGNRLDGSPCQVFDSNLRIRVARSILYTYPDATVVCGEPELDPQDHGRETIINPRLIVEVLSPSTEGFDRGDKFARYRQIESMQEYVLVSQDTPRIETFLRQAEGGWLLRVSSGLEASVAFGSLNIDLPLAEAYAGVTFDAAAT